MARVPIEALRCDRCGHVWKPRMSPKDVRICPRCKSARWNEPKESRAR